MALKLKFILTCKSDFCVPFLTSPSDFHSGYRVTRSGAGDIGFGPRPAQIPKQALSRPYLALSRGYSDPDLALSQPRWLYSIAIEMALKPASQYPLLRAKSGSRGPLGPAPTD